MNKLKDYENLIALMSIYRDEWKHRDNAFISMLWRFVYISLTITFLPNLINKLGIENSPLTSLPVELFSIAGIVYALFGAFITIGICKRIENVDKSFKKIMHLLPDEYRYEKIEERPFSFRLNKLLTTFLFSVVIILAIANIIFAHWILKY